MASIKIRAGNNTYTLYGVQKHVTRGGTSYTPSETVWNDAVRNRCLRYHTGSSSQDYYITAIPLMSSLDRNGTKFLSMDMAVGDSCPCAKQYNGVPKTLACRVDNKTLYACNATATVAAGDTVSWEEEITNLSNVLMQAIIYQEGTLTIGCTYYDENGNIISNTTGFTKPDIYMYANEVKIDDATAKGAIPSFRVELKNDDEAFWYEVNNGTLTKWDDFLVDMPLTAKFVLKDLDSRIKKIKATYTWTW